MATRKTWIAAAVALLACAAAGQRKTRIPRWKIDPYTNNDPALMAKLGYVSYGPFDFGQRGGQIATTEMIEHDVPYADLLWVETEHFRIGLRLDAWPVPFEPTTKKKIRGEIERLREKLPRFNPKTRTLDPWLRLHLIAQRLEDLYAELSDWLGVTDADFPKSKGDVMIGRGRFMGYGPYFGMQNKYLILVTEKTGTYLDYQSRYIGKKTAFGQRWHFTDTGSLFYGVAVEMDGGRLKHDTALHCNLVFNTTQLLVDGFRHYSYDLPVWLREGLAHWFERRVSPKWNSFTQTEGGLADKKPLWRWEPYTRKLVLSDKGSPFSELYTWRSYSQIKFIDHVLLWSRIDFLMSQGKKKFAELFFAVKGRVDPKTWLTDQSDLVGATREALQKAYGLTPLSFDERWKQYVLENYAAK